MWNRRIYRPHSLRNWSGVTFSAIGITAGLFHQRRTSSYGEETALLPFPTAVGVEMRGNFLRVLCQLVLTISK